MRISFKLLAGILMAAVLLPGCSSSTKINTLPRGAKIYVDGEFRGVTPYVLTDQKPVWGTTKIRIKKEGYKDFGTVIDKGEEFNMGACIGGALILVPFIWIMDYKPSRTFEMEREDSI